MKSLDDLDLAPVAGGTRVRLRVKASSRANAILGGHNGALKLSVGRAFDVEADRVQTDFQAVAGGRYDREAAFRIEVRNHKATVIQVRLREPGPGDWKLLESSIPGTRIDSGTLGFELSVPSGGTAEVTYRVAIDQG